MKYTFIKVCLLIGGIVGSNAREVSVGGIKCIVPDSWDVSAPEQGIDSVSGKILTDKEGFAIGWSWEQGDIVEQRSKDGAEVVIREDLKDKRGTIVCKMLIVKGAGSARGYWGYAHVGNVVNFHAYCKDRDQVEMFAKFFRSNFQAPKTIGNQNGKK